MWITGELNIELHLNKPDSELISSIKVPAGKVSGYTGGWQKIAAEAKDIKDSHRLYFVFKNPYFQDEYLLTLSGYTFQMSEALLSESQ